MIELEEDTEVTGVGRDLRAAREAVGDQIKDVAKALRIGAYHLEALEAGRFDELPEPVYVHGFVRSYAGYLKLDADEMVRRVRLELSPPIVPEELHFPASPQDAPQPSRKLLLLALLLAVGISGLWYLNTGSVSDAPQEVAAPKAPSGSVTDPVAPEEKATAVTPQAPTAPDAQTSSTADEAAAPQIPPIDELVGKDTAAVAGATVEPEESADGSSVDESVSGEDSTILAEEIGTPEISHQAVAHIANTTFPEHTVELPASPPLLEDASIVPAQPADSEIEAPSLKPAAAEQAEKVALNQAPSTGELSHAPVVLRASSDTWLQVTHANGAVLKSWVLRAGEQYAPPAGQTGLMAVIGNAGALTVFIDGAEMPPLGAKGAVVRAVPLDAGDLKSRLGG